MLKNTVELPLIVILVLLFVSELNKQDIIVSDMKNRNFSKPFK